MNDCCSTGVDLAHLRVADCFGRGLRTRRLAPLATVGPRVADDENGLWACFSVQAEQGRLADVRFNCASCTTLIACCQALAELSCCQALDAATALDETRLRARLPGIPVGKLDRVRLATQALHAILDKVPGMSRTPLPY